MKVNRRKFLISSSIGLAGSVLLSKDLFASITSKKTNLGLQLYSVRADMKSNPLDTLKQLSAMGYKNVEHAGYSEGKFYGSTPKEFKKILGDLGLKMPSGHSVLNMKHWNSGAKDFTDVWKKTVEDAASVGQKYIISPWLEESMRQDYQGLLNFLEIFNKAGELCKKNGLKFGYHNHNFEFKQSINGQLIYDIILEHTDPKLVVQQIDIGNMYGAGGRALEILKKYPGRFESMHVKDEIKSESKGEMDDQYDSTIIGSGLLPVKEIVDSFNKMGGTTQFIIEQESYQGKTPLECAKSDLGVMKNWGF